MLTPAFRMARFLPEAVDSVLAQDVQCLEYTVLDGGSDDGTVELLRSYGTRVSWRSEKDAGAADALRRGFAESNGSILGWLNADDILLPGALGSVLAAFQAHPGAVAVYSGGWWVEEDGRRLKPYPVSAEAAAQLGRECLICQPACFFRADAYRACGGIDASLRSAFDYELWMRLSRLGAFLHVPGEWALSRMHASNKSLGNRGEVFREAMEALDRHYDYVPFQWVYASLLHERDNRDQFFEELRPSLAAYARSLPAGLLRNRHHPLCYIKEWGSQMSWAGLRRRLGR
ncbi:MAG: glycosyltransferase [Candidatus Solibacter usitatus]|nr:glycosyltransferase [Candidatus Solibacter usitatus]